MVLTTSRSLKQVQAICSPTWSECWRTTSLLSFYSFIRRRLEAIAHAMYAIRFNSDHISPDMICCIPFEPPWNAGFSRDISIICEHCQKSVKFAHKMWSELRRLAYLSSRRIYKQWKMESGRKCAHYVEMLKNQYRIDWFIVCAVQNVDEMCSPLFIDSPVVLFIKSFRRLVREIPISRRNDEQENGPKATP